MFASSNDSNWVNLINPDSQPSALLPLPPPPPPPAAAASTSHPFPHFNYSHQDLPSNQFLPSNHETLIDNNYLRFLENGPTLGILSPSSSPLHSVAKFARKDRHSKICTSQGVRDRRVRLSISIAREFFDLQDMLGYDKASKTLEWLLNKSKKAIREIARAKRQETARSAFPAGCHMVMPEEAGHSMGPSSDLTNFKEMHMKEMPPQAVRNVDQLILGKEEAWTKARARASGREAREKICCFASPRVVGMHHQQSTGVHSSSSSSSRIVFKPCQYQRLPLSATPYDLTLLNTEFQNDFPSNWDINYNSMILQPSSFSLKDPGPDT